MFLPGITLAQSTEEASKLIVLNSPSDPDVVTAINYKVTIHGKIITPSGSGQSQMDLDSTAQFDFRQRRFQPAVSGPFGLRAIRRFEKGLSNTIVAKDHKTNVQLPLSHRLMQVYGTDAAVCHLSPDVRLTRQQVDLLQMPCDPLVTTALLPNRPLKDVTEKWNTDPWVLPLMFGMEAAVSQSAACQISALTESTATVRMQLKADGAVNGSASEIQLTGTYTFDRINSLITSLEATLTEKRSPGTVSPGLDITANVTWKQQFSDQAEDLPTILPETTPSESRLLLTLVTPWRLTMLHSREWHLFHETADLIMLRLLRNGSLIGQCNIAPSLAVPPGEFTPDEQFRSEVQQAVATRQASIASSNIVEDLNGWRIHTLRSESPAEKNTIHWDYHLCSHSSGQQFLIIFSHTGDQKNVFEPEAKLLLQSLTLRIAPSRPKITLPR